MKKIVLTGGGTAGHVYPALALCDKLKDYEIHYIGSSGMEKDILKKFPNIFYHEIPAVKLERKLTLRNFLIPFKLLKSIRCSKKVLKEISPNIIFSKGGFVAVPVAISASKLKIPVISHESDLSFGLANKIILHYCSCMCTSFEKTSLGNKKCVYTGQPIREKIFNGNKNIIDFKNNKPYLLVLGGSLGAKFLNNLVFDNIENLTEIFNVIHICGKNNYQMFAETLKLSLDETINYCTTKNGAIESALFYWMRNDINKICDKDDIKAMTKAINGGFNGLEDRATKYMQYKKILSNNNIL